MPPKRGHKFRAPCPKGFFNSMLFFQQQNVFCKKYATGLISGLLFPRESRTSYTRVGAWKKNRLSPSRKRKALWKRRCSARSYIFFKAMSTLSSLKNLTRKLEVTDEGRPTARQLQANVAFFNNDLMTACSRSPLSLLPLPLFFFVVVVTHQIIPRHSSLSKPLVQASTFTKLYHPWIYFNDTIQRLFSKK